MDGPGKPTVAFPYLPRCNPTHRSVTMEPSTAFAGPYANGLPPWHHTGYLDRPFNDDSGYASEDSDSTPFLSSDPDHDHEYTNPVNHGLPWMQRHCAAAFVSAQWSHPVAFRAWPPFHDPFNDSSRTYDLPQALPFEEQPNNYELGSRLKPTTSYNRREILDRGPGHTTSPWDLEEKIWPLDFEEHRARVPDALPSLSNRVIQSETYHYPPSPNSLRHNSPSPEVKLETSESLNSITSAQSDDRNGNLMPSSAQPRPQCQHRYSSHDAQLAAAWRQLYQERTELDKDRRALRKREKSLLRRREGTWSSRRDLSDGNGRS